MEKSFNNLKTVSTFIFVHDQNIILDYLKINKFGNLDDYKWVFLGNNPYDKIKNLDNLIISRNLPDNIEQYPKLTSFTGWYSLVKNNLIKSDYVNFFEYDIILNPKFLNRNKNLIQKNYDFIGYFPMPITDVVYLEHSQYTDLLISSIHKKTNFNMLGYLNDLIRLNPKLTWSSSSNSTWRYEILLDYVNWFTNFIEDIKDSQYCGHMHERSISFFYYIKNLKVKIDSGLMTHVQMNSHGTSPLSKQRSEIMYKNLLR